MSTKNWYQIYFEANPRAGSYEGEGIGWWVKVGNFEPWGPFETPGDAANSLAIEWPRFEEGYFDEED